MSVLPVGVELTLALVDDRACQSSVSTGSDVVGFDWPHAFRAKKSSLELGGDAAAIVCDDFSSDDDLAWVARRVATFSMYQAGQSCISVQRLLIAEGLAEKLIPMVVDEVRALGEVQSLTRAFWLGLSLMRVPPSALNPWIQEAISSGAELLWGTR